MYDMPDLDELDPATLSLCKSCAKDRTLKEFIAANTGGDAYCGVCLSPYTRDETCKLERRGDLTNLLKALVRFHFDESDYNPHWGGEHSPADLLYVENPIVHHETTLFSWREKDWSSILFEDLFGSEPYPDPKTGVSVYAGFDDGGGRMFSRSISRGENWSFWSFRRRLFTENHFDVEPDVREFITKAGDRIARTIPAGSAYQRARIGAHRFARTFEGSLAYKPYEGPELGAPPAPKATSGRLNRAGVAFLYLATDAETAAAEVRPHPSHLLSIGTFMTKQDLRIAAFDVGIEAFFGNEDDLHLFDFLFTADKAMSMPALPEDEMRYSITQLIADSIRIAGYDGVTFRSSVAGGQNLCVFSPDGLEYVEGTGTVLEVTKVNYGTAPATIVDATNAEDYHAIDN